MYEIFNSFEIIVLFSTTLTAFAKVITLDSVYLYNVLTSSSIPNIDCNLYLWGLWFSWSGIKNFFGSITNFFGFGSNVKTRQSETKVKTFLKDYNSHEAYGLNTLSIKEIKQAHQSVKNHNYDSIKKLLFDEDKVEQIQNKIDAFGQILTTDTTKHKEKTQYFLKNTFNDGTKFKKQTILQKHMMVVLSEFDSFFAKAKEADTRIEPKIIREKIMDIKNNYGMTLLFQDLYDEIGILFKQHNIQIDAFDPLAKNLLSYLQTELPITGLNFLYNYSSRARFMSSFVLLTENIKNLFTNILTEKGIKPAKARANLITCLANYTTYLDDNLEPQGDTIFLISSLHNLSVTNFRAFYQDYNIFKPLPKNERYATELLLKQDFCQKLSTLYLIKEYPKIKLADLSNEMQCKLLEIFELASINIDHKYNINTTSRINYVSYQVGILVTFEFEKYRDRNYVITHLFQINNATPLDIMSLNNNINLNTEVYLEWESTVGKHVQYSVLRDPDEEDIQKEHDKRLEIYHDTHKMVLEIANGIPDTPDLV
jgi:hypothetical protein